MSRLAREGQTILSFCSTLKQARPESILPTARYRKTPSTGAAAGRGAGLGLGSGLRTLCLKKLLVIPQADHGLDPGLDLLGRGHDPRGRREPIGSGRQIPAPPSVSGMPPRLEPMTGMPLIIASMATSGWFSHQSELS